MEKTYLNVGCGPRFYKGEPWINLDVSPRDEAVRPWDVRIGFPFEADTIDVVYLSHVLEHFSEKEGARLMGECHRVLKNAGVLRVVVPDLEGICREYLCQLDAIRAAPPGNPDRLAWIKLEMLDQCMRHESGGRMKTFFCDHGRAELDYVVSRIGTVGVQLAKVGRPSTDAETAKRQGFSGLDGGGWKSIRAWLREALLSAKEKEALRIGQFRTQGEVHLCMYDSFTIEKMLKGVGFEVIEFLRAEASQIPNWSYYCLDLESDGREHAPNSLYVEGRKRS